MEYGKTKERKPSLDSVLKKLMGYAESVNIAEDLDDDKLGQIGAQVKREYDVDVDSRSDWYDSAKKAMDIAMQVRQPKNYPFEGASNVKYPLVTVAALQFGARAYPAIVDGNRIVKGAPIGSDPDGQKRAKADRISTHMSWQLLYEMEEWEEDTDVLLHHLPVVGCAFRKVWRSDELGRNKCEMVQAIDLVVNNKAKSLDDAPRITHEITLYPHEIQERQLNGTFLDVDLPKPNSSSNDDDAPHKLLEQHRYIDLDEDGYREPYIVTIHKDTCKVLRIVANYDFEKISHDAKQITRIPKDQYFVKYSFLPDPEGGFYDIGFGKLLESLSATIDTALNQMLDAGNLQNAGGGLIGSGVRLKKGELRLQPGKYVYAESSGSNIRDAVYNWEHPGPSPVLFNILELMLSAATDITGVKDIMTGETGTRGAIQPTTILAMIEQGLKVFTAIYKRVYRALRDEFKLLFLLNAKNITDEEYFTVLDEQQSVAKADYDWESIDVMPVADPRMVTDMQKMGRAQFLQSFLGTGMINDAAALKRIFDAVGIENPDELMPQPDPAQQMVAEMEMKGVAAEVDSTLAEMEKTQAETEKIRQETGLAPAIKGHERELAERDQALEEFKAQAGVLESADKLRQADLGQMVDIADKEANLEMQEEALKKRAASEAA